MLNPHIDAEGFAVVFPTRPQGCKEILKNKVENLRKFRIFILCGPDRINLPPEYKGELTFEHNS